MPVGDAVVTGTATSPEPEPESESDPDPEAAWSTFSGVGSSVVVVDDDDDGGGAIVVGDEVVAFAVLVCVLVDGATVEVTLGKAEE